MMIPCESGGRSEDDRRSESGAVFALADTILADGVYEARVTYRQTQVITLLFN